MADGEAVVWVRAEEGEGLARWGKEGGVVAGTERAEEKAVGGTSTERGVEK